ncbi:hypothetical protein AB0D24_15570 [Streptomyces javensis]|uniref:hypothetical protein n=1 Tax=Streptomyces javensis TaxID=114698 RepID=UPI0033D6769A
MTTAIPRPADPRSPLQAARDRVRATAHQLVHTHLPLPQRQELADQHTRNVADLRALESGTARG